MALGCALFGKKAFFFTLISVIIVSIFFVVYVTSPLYEDTEFETAKMQISAINDFARNFKEVYLKELVSAATVNFIDKLRGSVPADEVISEEELNELYSEEMQKVLRPSFENVSKIAGDAFNYDLRIIIPEYSLLQDNPWSVNSIMLIKLLRICLNHCDGESPIEFFYENEYNTVNVSIIGWKDPLFTSFNEERRVYDTEISEWGASGVKQFLEEGKYRESKHAPSFLDRTRGDFLHKSSYGIESLMKDTPAFFASTDYLYLTAKEFCDEEEQIWELSDEIESGFSLDAQHMMLYKLDQYMDEAHAVCELQEE